MRVLVLGADGYIGYSLVCTFLREGWVVGGVDNFDRELLATKELNCPSITPHEPPPTSLSGLGDFHFWRSNLNSVEEVKRILTEFSPEVIVDAARTYTPLISQYNLKSAILPYRNVQSFFALAFVLRELRVPWLVLSDIHTYFPSTLPIPEGKVLISHQASEFYVPFPTRMDSPYLGVELLAQALVEFFRSRWELPVIDLRVGLVYGVLKEKPWHRLHVDVLQGNFVNYFCAKGVRQGVVNVPFEGYFAIISLQHLCNRIKGLLLSKVVRKSPTHFFDCLVSFQDLIYKIKHVFSEDFGYRLRVGFFGTKTPRVGWPFEVNVARDPLNEKIQLATIDEEVRDLIDVCFTFRKQVNALPQEAMSA